MRRNEPPTSSKEQSPKLVVDQAAEMISLAESDDPLAGLVGRCRAGDREAQAELYQACQQDVFGLMLRMVGRQDAPDLSQQVFMQAFRKMEQFQGNSKFQTWLYRLAVNLSLQHLRKNKRKTQVLDCDPVDNRPTAVRQRDGQEILSVALGRLEPLLRSIFLLKEQNGFSYREIAEVTDIPEGTVGSRLNRARKQLREFLVELEWEQ